MGVNKSVFFLLKKKYIVLLDLMDIQTKKGRPKKVAVSNSHVGCKKERYHD